jgi:hypothetical protein
VLEGGGGGQDGGPLPFRLCLPSSSLSRTHTSTKVSAQGVEGTLMAHTSDLYELLWTEEEGGPCLPAPRDKAGLLHECCIALLTALCRGNHDQPSDSSALTSAPRSRSWRTTAAWPLSTAHRSGRIPPASLASTSAPTLRRTDTKKRPPPAQGARLHEPRALLAAVPDVLAGHEEVLLAVEGPRHERQPAALVRVPVEGNKAADVEESDLESGDGHGAAAGRARAARASGRCVLLGHGLYEGIGEGGQ